MLSTTILSMFLQLLWTHVAPIRRVITRHRPTPLYLKRDTLGVMAARDRAALSGAASYCQLRNRASHLVRRDRLESAKAYIAGSVSGYSNSSAKLWRLANSVLGHVLSPLPRTLVNEGGSPVTEVVDLANLMNNFFISKIQKLREGFTDDALPMLIFDTGPSVDGRWQQVYPGAPLPHRCHQGH